MALYHRISVRAQATTPRHIDYRSPHLIRGILAFLLVVCTLAAPAVARDPGPRWRAVLLDTFDSSIGNGDEAPTVIARAVAMNVDVLYVQVRGRGDAFYLEGREPAPEGVTIADCFDPLGDLLDNAGRPAGADDVVSDGWGVFATPAIAPGAYGVQLPAPARGAFTGDCTVGVAPHTVTRITLIAGASRAGVASCR